MASVIRDRTSFCGATMPDGTTGACPDGDKKNAKPPPR
jgi:hypothetical protein